MGESDLYTELGVLTREKSKWKENIPYVSSLLNHESVSIAVKYSLLMAPDRNIVTKKIILNAVWPGNEKTDRIVMPEKGKQSRTADVLPEMNYRQ